MQIDNCIRFISSPQPFQHSSFLHLAIMWLKSLAMSTKMRRKRGYPCLSPLLQTIFFPLIPFTIIATIADFNHKVILVIKDGNPQDCKASKIMAITKVTTNLTGHSSCLNPQLALIITILSIVLILAPPAALSTIAILYLYLFNYLTTCFFF